MVQEHFCMSITEQIKQRDSFSSSGYVAWYINLLVRPEQRHKDNQMSFFSME